MKGVKPVATYSYLYLFLEENIMNKESLESGRPFFLVEKFAELHDLEMLPLIEVLTSFGACNDFEVLADVSGLIPHGRCLYPYSIEL